MSVAPRHLNQYHVFLASPGDVQLERQQVRRFFDDYNRHTAHLWNTRFELIDWENCASIGVGRPQELITQQTLDKYRDSLVLVIGLMAQRFGSPSGKAESGTEEECEWALQQHAATGFPELKWYFRKIEKLEIDPDHVDESVAQWSKVKAFRQRFDDPARRVWCAEYPGAEGFADVLRKDLNLWLADATRPWAAQRSRPITPGTTAAGAVPAVDVDAYRRAVQQRFGKLSFEMLDTTGAYYGGVRLWSVFVPQSVRECHEYNPRLLEIPKEDQRRLLEAGELTDQDLAHAEREAERLRQQYFNQPLRPVLDAVDLALQPGAQARTAQRLVVLGDPGAGKSSLIRYLALRWAETQTVALPSAGRLPLVIELGAYARWACEGRRDPVRYLEQAPGWHDWLPGALGGLLALPGGAVLLLDGLDEVFDAPLRQAVLEDIQRFCGQHPQTAVIVTSRVVGYAPERLRNADFRHFMLQDLSTPQIDEFLARWHTETFDDAAAAAPKRDRLAKAIRNSRSIAMLAGNPLLLTMMAILNRHQELPRDRAELYGQAARVLLHQWDTERALIDFPGLSAEIGLREKTELLRRVAFDMQAAPGGLKGNLIGGERLERLIEDYLRTELGFTQARAAARAVVEQLRLRNFILCFVGANSYAFVHRTFLEYFCAAEYVHRFTVAQTLNIDGLMGLFDLHCREDEWREVLRLICGQIDEVFIARIIDNLARRIDRSTRRAGEDWPDLLLAVGCLSEARTLSRIEDASVTLMLVLLKLYIAGAGSEALHQQLLAAVKEIGPRWPGASGLANIVRQIEIQIDEHSWATIYLVRFVNCIAQDRVLVEQWAKVENYGLRCGAIESLSESWPDDATRNLVASLAAHDDHYLVRCASIRALAKAWPDNITRALLVHHAAQDKHNYARAVALEALAKYFPNLTTREFLTQRAVVDEYSVARSAALEALALTWPDNLTRVLLVQRAELDAGGHTRSTALTVLSRIWPVPSTCMILAKRAADDPEGPVRGRAASLLGTMHSTLAGLVYTRDMDGGRPYKDPRQPVSAKQIAAAAAAIGIAPEEFGAQLASLSEFLGWDVTVGLQTEPAKSPRQRKFRH